MHLLVTVALGTTRYKTARFERLLKTIGLLSDTVELELPDLDVDDKNRWSYTFSIWVDNVKILKDVLHNNGRFKTLAIVDRNDLGEVSVPQKKHRKRKVSRKK